MRYIITTYIQHTINIFIYSTKYQLDVAAASFANSAAMEIKGHIRNGRAEVVRRLLPWTAALTAASMLLLINAGTSRCQSKFRKPVRKPTAPWLVSGKRVPVPVPSLGSGFTSLEHFVHGHGRRATDGGDSPPVRRCCTRIGETFILSGLDHRWLSWWTTGCRLLVPGQNAQLTKGGRRSTP